MLEDLIDNTEEQLALKVNKSGDTMTGNLVFKAVAVSISGTYTITEGLGQAFNITTSSNNVSILLPPNPPIGLQILIRNDSAVGLNLIVRDSAGVAVTRGTVVPQLTLVFTRWASGWAI